MISERAVPLIPRDAQEIGISGGEPALLGARLVKLFGADKARLLT